MASSPDGENLELRRLPDTLDEIDATPAEPKGVRLPLIRPPNACESRKAHSFKYEPLPTSTSIRLLELFLLKEVEGSFDMHEPIQCSVVVKDLNDFPVYEALSYTWGDPLTLYSSPDEVSPPEAWSSPAFDIYCNGEPLTVFTNLYTAFLSLRWIETHRRLLNSENRPEQNHSHRPALVIWVDALCINQRDLEERSHQITMMSRIYRQAQTVNIWLGGEDEIARNALATIEGLGEINLRMTEQVRSLKITDENIYEKIGFPRVSTRQWIEIYAFFNRTWFKRAWVVQEVALANTAVFFCGLVELRLSWVAWFLKFLGESRWAFQVRKLAEPCIEGWRSNFHMNVSLPYSGEGIRLYQARPGNLWNHGLLVQILSARAALGIEDSSFSKRKGIRVDPLWILLQNHRSTESTDPRDKIYAFMGISREFVEKSHQRQGPEFIPDYAKPVRDVFVEAAKFMIASQGHLELLALKEAEFMTKIRGLPSWVPDFSTEGLSSLSDIRPMPWTASEGLGLTYVRHVPGDALEVRAAKVGEVAAVHDFEWIRIAQLPEFLRGIPEVSEVRTPKMNERMQEYLLKGDVQVWSPWREGLPEGLQADGVIKHQSRFEVLWRTLLVDCFAGQHPAPEECGAAVLTRMEHIVELRLMTVATSLIDDTPASPPGREATTEVSDVNDVKADLGNANELGRAYTAWKILQGHHPHESNDIIYPPEFLTFTEEVKAAHMNSEADECAWSHFAEFVSRCRRGSNMDNLGVEVDFKIYLNSSSRKLFTTVHGHLGNGIRSIQVGDEIWLIAGASVPFVLRPRADGRYSLVGDAYVHGIMHGEAVLASSSGAGVQTIILV